MRKKLSYKHLLLLSLILLASMNSHAFDENIDKIFEVNKGGELTINSKKGTIQIESWKKNEVHIDVLKRSNNRDALKAFEVDIRKKGNNVVIEGHGKRSSKLNIKYRVKIPFEFNIHVKTGGGSITIGDQQGTVFARTSGGSIKVGNVDGDVDVDTSGGSIKIGQITGLLKVDTSGGSIRIDKGGKKVNADTSGGSIHIGPSDGDVAADTSGGSIRIGHSRGNVKADTSGGSIRIDGSEGSVSADTSGGSIRIDNVVGPIEADTSGGGISITRARGSIKADTSGGNISAELISDDPSIDTQMHLDTSNGSITVYLPESLKATISAQTNRRGKETKIYSDFPIDIKSSEGYSIAKGNINGGGDAITLKSSHGPIYIKKLP